MSWCSGRFTVCAFPQRRAVRPGTPGEGSHNRAALTLVVIAAVLMWVLAIPRLYVCGSFLPAYRAMSCHVLSTRSPL